MSYYYNSSNFTKSIVPIAVTQADGRRSGRLADRAYALGLGDRYVLKLNARGSI